MDGVSVKKYVNSLFNSASYLIWHKGNEQCIVVDCGDTEQLIEDIKDRGLVPVAILLTHVHFDHIYGVNEMLSAFPDLKIYTNEWGHKALMSDKLNLSRYHGSPFVVADEQAIVDIVENEEMIEVAGMNIHTLYTPGHNPSCITYYTEDMVFTGDAYIPNTPVVTCLPHGNRQEAEQSLDAITLLMQGRRVMPGHDVE